MSKYDKELDTRTEEYDEAIEPLDRATTSPEEKTGEKKEEEKEDNP
ncbi:MAG TPA: hypothetical protein VEK11_09545 [Thermoanaerobaculia bacterium]|nr:hypothetical protein [Thermoanaerobaculia bacterium]